MYSFTAAYQNQRQGMQFNLSKIYYKTLGYCITLKSIVFSLIRFGAFETIKGLLADDTGNLSGSGKLLAGLGAGVCEAVVAVTPMETIKVKFINDQRSANPQYKGFFHGVQSIIKSEGTINT